MKNKTPLKVRGTLDNFVPFYKSLDPNHKLYKSITETIDIIRKDPTRGDHVEHNKIPSFYIKKYKIKTLFRIELVSFWRLMYSIHTFENLGTGVLVLEALDHKQYNKRFGYKG